MKQKVLLSVVVILLIVAGALAALVTTTFSPGQKNLFADYGYSDFSAGGGFPKSIERFPPEKREALRQMFKTLTTLPKGQLDFLKASDPCIDPDVLDCSELADIDTRRFVEVAISQISDARAASDIEWTLRIALASLGISFASLFLMLLKFRRESAVK